MKAQLFVFTLFVYFSAVSAWTFKFCTGTDLGGKCLEAHSNPNASGCWNMNSPVAGHVKSFRYVGSKKISLYNGSTKVGSSQGSWYLRSTSSAGSKMNKYCIN
ncbi:hypothetical protein K501DRAFT_279038 [Backusella circina FSU 941]|nr:hypothetical protein K501DRAFT_279038 [Backusella circina FSU 941]